MPRAIKMSGSKGDSDGEKRFTELNFIFVLISVFDLMTLVSL